MSDKIYICISHSDYPVPLISTMSFMGAEKWCPYCGNTYGIFGGKLVEYDKALIHRHDIYVRATHDFRRATGILHCSSTRYRGKQVDADKLPKSFIKKVAKIATDGWKYGNKAEDTPIQKRTL